ncbi:FliA/WhiG family RNA polymerase sigma factor [Candidatus Poribacteria bacterium]|nr:MAG: FliA/WhiG family RNA polymerase sigma factor [Candidatus Poribacteria bacterium]
MRSLEDLWRAYKLEGDRKAKDEIIMRCLPMIKAIASRFAIFASPSQDVNDLISAGIIGLLDAIEKFDPSKKASFKTYATYRIKGAILDEIRALDWVPRNVREKAQILENAYAALEQKLMRPPTEEEVAEYLKISVDKLRDMLLEVQGAALLTLDDIVLDEETGESIREHVVDKNTATPEQKMAYEEAKKLLARAIEGLPEKEKLVLSLYYYEEMTMKEIGRVLGVSESRVSQIHSSAILRLKGKLKMMKGELMPVFERKAYV